PPRDGHLAMATARRTAAVAALTVGTSGRVRVQPLDLLNVASITRAVDATIDAFGRLDVLLSCGGVGLVGSVEESSTADVRRVFETNVFGTHQAVAAVLPHMRSRASGHV